MSDNLKEEAVQEENASKIQWNHDAETFTGTAGLGDEFKEKHKKFIKETIEIIVGSEGEVQKSHLAEKVEKAFSHAELVVLATDAILNFASEMMAPVNPMEALMEALSEGKHS